MREPLAFHELPNGRGATTPGVGGMSWPVALRLGRVSNLPTIWSNVLAGIVLSGAAITGAQAIPLMISLSLFYVGGMFLNDAFDRELDQRTRPDRPIPAGDVRAATVFVYGFGLLALGLALLLAVGYGMPQGTGWRASVAGVLLAAMIVLYDIWHKANPIGPLLMGLCRLLVYIIAGIAVAGAVPERLSLAAFVSLCYLIGLTYVAKQENLQRVKNIWPLLFLAVPFAYAAPFAVTGGAVAVLAALLLATVLFALVLMFRPGASDIPHAMMLLIAGISLLDGLFMAGQGQTFLSAVSVAAFLLTLAFQRFIAGT
jgi:4-hydroxybenzoate polyprenyltransferase